MIRFIPAWYNPQRAWYSSDGAWFRAASGRETDDTVTQLRVFRQGDEATELVVLNYAPSLRRFLHAQDVFDVPYWSFFDAIQGLADDYAQPIDFLALDWPEDVSFYYNPFLVTVMRDAEVYARVYLAKDGTLQSIRYFGDGMPTLERIFDDRGFPSSVLMHDEDGRPMTQYYLSRGGDVIVSEDVPSGRIDIVQNPDGRFEHGSYESWPALIAEFLAAHLSATRGLHDTVVVAVAPQHDELVVSALSDEMLVLSRSANRPSEVESTVLHRAGAVFSDVGAASAASTASAAAGDPASAAAAWAHLPELSVYPLERRSSFGASANEATVYISLFVDDITTEQLDYAIAMAAGQLVGDERTRLLVCTFRSYDLDYLNEIKRVIAGYQHLDLAFLAEDPIAGLGVDLGTADGAEEKIQLVHLDREEELTRTIAKSRVLVDLGATVSYRLATEAVNAGVPQIARYEHELMTHPINGYVVADESELPTALDHFLSGLEHWNQSLVQCRVLQDLFRPQEVLDRWGLVKEGAAYAGPADRA